jgi:hypothetical protein
MDAKGKWRQLAAWRPPSAGAESEPEEGMTPSPGELRQRHLMRLRAHGIPVWSEEAEHHDGCGRALLAGEKPVLVRGEGGLLLACPLCAERLYDEGCLRVSVDVPGDAEETPQLPVAV